MNKIKKSKAQAGSAGKKVYFSEEVINRIIYSSNPKEELRLLLSKLSKSVICGVICQYFAAHNSFNKNFEELLVADYLEVYVDALKKTLAFTDENRYVFLAEKMYHNILDLIGEYFRKSQFDERFEKLVAEKTRKVFIKAIRANRAFMDGERLEFYTKDKGLKIPIEHLETWEWLKKTENALWSRVEETFESFKTENKRLPSKVEQLCSAMMEVIIWMERRRWDEQGEIRGVLCNCYNLFVEKYFRDYGITMLDFKYERVEEELVKQWATIITQQDSTAANELFESIFSWVVFKNNVLDAYCFDMTFMPRKTKSGSLYLSQSPKCYYRWKLNGLRYDINRIYYSQISGDIVDEFQKSCPKIDEMNMVARDSMIGVSLILEDLCLSKLTWNSKDIVDINQVFKPLICLSVNRLFRYEKPLELYKQRGIKSWDEACVSLFRKEGVKAFPFSIYTKDAFLQQTKEVGFSEDTVNLATDLFGRFCFMFEKGDFDRFKKKSYDVMSNPFLMIGKDTYFTPTLFLANNDWLYGSAEKVMEMYTEVSQEIRKDNANWMEKKLADMFEQKGWKKYCYHDGDKRKPGDVDIIVEDEETALLIQLKRTKFRPTPYDQYLEIVNIDNKAFYQLYAYKYKGEKQNVVRWYVTNSYENCLYTHEGCTKVNYMDLIRLLETNRKWSKLDDLIKYVAEDSYLKKELYLNMDVRSCLRLLGMILPMAQPHQYDILIKSKDDESHEKLNSILDKSKMDIEDRLKIAKDLSKIIPDDCGVWDVLADIYTDKGEFDKAIACSKRALKISGYDPFLLHNYAVTLRKKRKCHALILPPLEEELKVVKVLMEQYWFLDFGI